MSGCFHWTADDGFLDRVRDRYAIRFEALSPDAMAVERLMREKGLSASTRTGTRSAAGSARSWEDAADKERGLHKANVVVGRR
jgi:hypothetical protein